MRNASFILAALLALGLMAAPEARAQRTSDFSVTVTANNLGIFACSVNTANFDFGDVDADGADHSTTDVTAGGRNTADDGGFYTNDAGSITWECRAAPSSSVDVALTSVAGDHTGTGGMGADNLEVKMSGNGSGTATPTYSAFTSAATLVSGMSVGNGANKEDGDLDLRLNVYDTDGTGSNQWIVKLRATGSP